MSCEPEIAQAVRERGRRLTIQRAKILSALRHASDHQSAEQILDRVRDDDPHADISLSTVYRTLETSTGLQLTSELRGASGTSVFEWNDPGHDAPPPGVPRLRHHRGSRSLLAADRGG